MTLGHKQKTTNSGIEAELVGSGSPSGYLAVVMRTAQLLTILTIRIKRLPARMPYPGYLHGYFPYEWFFNIRTNDSFLLRRVSICNHGCPGTLCVDQTYFFS